MSHGSCELQAVAASVGVTHVRYPYNNPRLPVDMTHPRFVLDHNRCILCMRSVRVCAELEGAHVWEIAGRGVSSRLVSETGLGSGPQLHQLRKMCSGMPHRSDY